MHISLYSPLHQRTFAARLKRGIADSFRFRNQPIVFFWKKPVAGEVWVWSDGTIRFFIFKRRIMVNSLAPRLQGKIVSLANGSTISAQIDIRHMLVEIILFPGLMVLLLAYSLSSYLIAIWQKHGLLLGALGIILLAGILIEGWLELRYLEHFLIEFVNSSSKFRVDE